MKKVETLKPFTKFLMTIGEIPTSYLVSMTYEEQLLWFCNYLENTVVPTIDNNAEAVIELQNYVKNYFDNLDVQEEVNNKLDEMAESGQLEEIISEYLNTRAILGFSNLNSLKNSENLANGTFAKTYGRDNMNDTFGEFYKIRTILNTDVIDDDNLVALTNFPTLVAEKIKDPYITLLVGDSYGVDYSPNTGWATKYIQYNNLTEGYNAIKICVGSSGFNDINGGTNDFLHNLQTYTASINKKYVKKIIVCGGFNDRTQSKAELETLISTFMTYVKSNFPNAKTYIGMIANYGAVNPMSGSLNVREWLATEVLEGYRSCTKYGAYYLNGVETVMHKYSLFNTSDYVHPNNDGASELAIAITQAENGNYYQLTRLYTGISLTNTTITKDSDISTVNIVLNGNICNGIFNIRTIGSINFANYKLVNATDTSISINIGTYTESLEYFRYTNYLCEIPLKARLTLHNSNELHVLNGVLVLNGDGTINMTLYNDLIDGKYIKSVILIPNGYSLPVIAQ